MILKKQHEVEVHGMPSQKQFTINASAQAFKILSDGLYSNKEASIIRELSCNALDSHIANGNKQTPFQIHIPTILTSHFSIRDYGTGLSNEDIENIYTTYFASTKSSSNDYVGALGLGSKSPFSYTDSFIVESWFNNIKTTYAIFYGDDGYPTYSKICEEETNEPSGLKVSFECKEDDIHKWKSASKLLNEFEVLPDINIPIPSKGEVKLSLDSAEIRSSNDYGSSYYAKQGPVLYRIDSNQIPSDIQRITSYNMVIFPFEMGEISFTASREEISFDESTIAIVQERFKQYDIEVSDYYKKELEPFNDAAVLKYNEKAEELAKIAPFDFRTDRFQKTVELYTYSDNEVQATIQNLLPKDWNFLKYTLDTNLEGFYLRNGRTLKRDSFNTLSIYSMFLLEDTKLHRESIKTYLLQNRGVKYFYVCSQAQIDRLKLFNLIDDAFIKKMSDIRIRVTPKERIKIESEKQDTRKYIMSTVNEYGRCRTENITLTDFRELEGYYLPLDSYNRFASNADFFSGLLKEDEKVYFINKIFVKNTKMKSFIPVIKKSVKLANTQLISNYVYNGLERLENNIIHDAEIRKIYNKLMPSLRGIKIKNYLFDYQDYKFLLESLNIPAKFDKYNNFAGKNPCISLIKHFNLLGQVYNYSIENYIEEIKIYMKAKMKFIKI